MLLLIKLLYLIQSNCKWHSLPSAAKYQKKVLKLYAFPAYRFQNLCFCMRHHEDISFQNLLLRTVSNNTFYILSNGSQIIVFGFVCRTVVRNRNGIRIVLTISGSSQQFNRARAVVLISNCQLLKRNLRNFSVDIYSYGTRRHKEMLFKSKYIEFYIR